MRIFALLMLGLALQLATSAQAQNATKPANEFLITLGTAGGPVPRFERAGISTLIQVNGESYLFDAGAGMTRQLAGAKVSLLDIQKIFLTHLHDDHYSGLGDFAGQLAALKPEKTIDIYGPGLTKSVVEGLHAFMYANRLIRETERKFPQRIDIYVAHEIKPGEVYKDENIRVTAIENHHFHFPNGSPPDGKTTSLSYRIETPNRVIVITGDTGAFEGLATFASGAEDPSFGPYPCLLFGSRYQHALLCRRFRSADGRHSARIRWRHQIFPASWRIDVSSCAISAGH